MQSPRSKNEPPPSQQPIAFSTDDLAQLETFDEQSIITYMYNRFLANQIYTYIGDILVVSSMPFLFKTPPARSVSCLPLGRQPISFVTDLW